MILQRSLSLLSNRLARAGGRRIPEAVLERDYCTAWFLLGLARCLFGKRAQRQLLRRPQPSRGTAGTWRCFSSAPSTCDAAQDAVRRLAGLLRDVPL